jgi:Arm DNA-binding domain
MVNDRRSARQGRQRIKYDFRLNGVRYRPNLKAIPTEANLRRARERLKAIKEQIRCGTFSFMNEFPDFRDWQKLVPHSSYRTRNQVFDQHLAHCESRLALLTRSAVREGSSGGIGHSIGHWAASSQGSID